MKKSILAVFSTATLPLLLLGSEPSAFNAGNIESPEPYGLTQSEKVIFENKQRLHKISVKTSTQQNEVESLRQRLDGLQTVLENLTKKSHKNKIELQKLQETNKLTMQNFTSYEDRLGKVVQTNSESVKKLEAVMLELSNVINKVNADYVTKDEYNALVKDVNDFKQLVVKELKASSKKVSSGGEFAKMTNAQIAKKAQSLFDQKYYTKSIKYYNHLITKHYKPAYANYMIGEMNFRRKNYANAIAYFKKSASLYKNASYMPELMLHSAISMEKTGDVKHAKAFYNAILTKYPESVEAVQAHENLNNL